MTEKELRTVLAKGIRRARQRLGLTIERLAEAAGLGAGYVAHLELGSKTPSLAALARLIDALKIKPEELLRRSRKRDTVQLDSLDRRLQARLRGLSRREKSDLLAVLGKVRDADQVRGLRMLLKAQ